MRIKEKIEKLLALAENAGTPEEAELASRRAEEMMVKWGIETAHLQDRSDITEKIVEVSRSYNGDYAIVWIPFCGSIVRSLGALRTLQSKGCGSSRRFYIVGFQSDVDRATMLLDSLEKQAWFAMRTWWRTAPERGYLSPMEGYKARRSFLESFSYAVARRLREMRTTAIADDTRSTELVLVSREEKVNHAMDQMYPNLRPARGRMQGSAFGVVEGAAAGQQASLGKEIE